MIVFSKPYYNINCLKYIEDGITKNISYNKKCEDFLNNKYNFKHSILTTSCTHSLEMMAMILNIGYDDEVLIPSYTFVSTANAFIKFGATIKCIDSEKTNPNIDPNKIEENISKKTKALVIVHYGGWSCNMDKIIDICKKHNIYLLEDAAQAINCYYKNKSLGTFGILAAFSFHSTKNINCGEGGLLVINDLKLIEKAHIICDKGTNRYDFLNNKINKYEWIDKGSSYPLANINACYLYDQLINIDNIIQYRKNLWKQYKKNLEILENNNIFFLCKEYENCISNYHIFYILFKNNYELNNIQKYLKCNNIDSCTHYVPLHKSKYYINNFKKCILENSENISNILLRLPLYNDLSINDIDNICNIIKNYYNYKIYNILYKNLSKIQIENIIQLKSQFWKYSYNEQKEWIEKNIKNEDTNILIYKNNKLICYGVILNRNCKIIDSIIVDKNNKNFGYGSILIKYITNYIKHNGFLLCEKKNINFYKKYGWTIDNTINVINKNIDNNLYKMIYNFSLKCVKYL